MRFSEFKKYFTLTNLRYLLTAAIAVFVFLMIFAGRQSGQPFENVAGAVETAAEERQDLRKAGRKEFKRCYDLDTMDYEGVLYYQAMTGMSAEEILLVRVKDEAQVREVQEAMKNRMETRANDFSGYAPAEEKLVRDASILVNGKYVFFVISDDKDVFLQAYQESL